MGLFSAVTSLFGGSKSKQQSTQSSLSENLAYPFLQQQYGGTAGLTRQSSSALAAMLGLGGDTRAQNAAFSNFRNNTGYDFLQNEGQRATDAAFYARGLGNSGAALKALQDRRMSIADQSYNSYLDRLFGLSDTGLKAGTIISGAGERSQSQGQSTGSSGSNQGLVAGLGKIAATAAMFSDRRLKDDIVQIGHLENGLPVYSYVYKWEDEPRIGVMADEVAEIQPEALGPVVDGYQTVDYSKINMEVV